jgi:hypothetical protein
MGLLHFFFEILDTCVCGGALVSIFSLFFFSVHEEDLSFIEIVDSEDEDLQRTLKESLTSSAPVVEYD